MTLPIDDLDINFVLYQQLGLESLFQHPAFSSLAKEDVDMVLAEAWRFARGEIWPANAVGDTEGCRFSAGSVRVPSAFHALHAAHSANGWVALEAPEAYGGAAMPASVAIAVSEVFIGANTAFGTYTALCKGVARLLVRFGDDWMKEHFAHRLYAGEWLGTMCLTEPQAGSAVSDIRSTAVRDGDGWLLTGSKIFITGGEHDLTPNIVHLVLARTEGAPAGIRGLSVFMVPKLLVGADGSLGIANDIVCSGIEEKMGMHGSATCSMNFGDEGRCRAWLLGDEGAGIKVMFHLMNEARIGTGMQGLATGSVCYQLALAYARERVQGVALEKIRDPGAPRIPIIQHPDVKRMLYTMKARVEGMRALTYRGAWLSDLAETHPDPETRSRSHELLELLTPIIKAWCTDTGFAVAVMSLQTHGGYGYTREYKVEQQIRDTKAASIYEGTNGIQALDLVGRKLARKAGASFRLLVSEIDGLTGELDGHPDLGELAGLLAKETGRVKQVTGKLAMAGLSGDLALPASNATPYLAMVGNLVVGWLLLEQALVAHRLLAGGAELGEEQRDHVASKSVTAAFYLRSLLPENLGLARAITQGDRSYLEAEL